MIMVSQPKTIMTFGFILDVFFKNDQNLNKNLISS